MSLRYSLQEQYSQLISLTKLHLMQEFAWEDLLDANRENYNFFRQQALSRKQSPAPIIQPNASVQQSPLPTQVKQPPMPSAAKNPTPNPHIQPPQKITETPQAQQIPPGPSSEISVPTKKSSEFIHLEPLSPPTSVDLNDIRKIVQEKYPQQQLRDDPYLIQEEVYILSTEDNPLHQALLNNLAKAITLTGHMARSITKIEAENLNPLLLAQGLRLVIAARPFLDKFPQLSKTCQENGLILLPLMDLAVYLKEPMQKASLWKSLCEILK